MSTSEPSRPVRFAAVGLDHAHAFGQIEGLRAQGCALVGLSSDDPSADVARAARGRWPDAPWADDPASLLHDPDIDLIVTAAVPDRRAAIALEALRGGKDVVADKPGCITIDQLDKIERAVAESGHFWSVTFSERFEVRCAIKAGQLVREGRIGKVVQTLGLGPHRETDRAHLAGGQGVRSGSTTGTGPAGSSPISRATRSTSSSGSPARRPPTSCRARSPTTPTPIRRPCRTSVRRHSVRRALTGTSGSTGTPRRACPPGVTVGSWSWAPRVTSSSASTSTSPAGRVGTTSSSSTAQAPSTSIAPTSC